MTFYHKLRELILMVPDLTHLQFLVLTALLDGERRGRDVRELLADEGHRKTAPAFYQMMSRMEDSRLIKGWYDEKIVEGQRIKERWYKVTGHGQKAWDEVREFYLSHAKRRVIKGL